jgi:(E)-4-hydroxy-3-methylbut-2-enyl-diphosphate synthase
VLKTKLAFQELLGAGIGDTIRVSLTLPDERKYEELVAARQLMREISKGELLDRNDSRLKGLNIVSCPSCSRVENAAFVKLAEEVEQALEFAKNESLTVAVMGCRVNGPGETDEADLGLWCAPAFVNLKRKSELLGRFRYDEVVDRLVQEVRRLKS